MAWLAVCSLAFNLNQNNKQNIMHCKVKLGWYSKSVWWWSCHDLTAPRECPDDCCSWPCSGSPPPLGTASPSSWPSRTSGERPPSLIDVCNDNHEHDWDDRCGALEDITVVYFLLWCLVETVLLLAREYTATATHLMLMYFWSSSTNFIWICSTVGRSFRSSMSAEKKMTRLSRTSSVGSFRIN